MRNVRETSSKMGGRRAAREGGVKLNSASRHHVEANMNKETPMTNEENSFNARRVVDESWNRHGTRSGRGSPR